MSNNTGNKRTWDHDRAVRSFNFDKVVVSKTDRGVEARTHKRMDRFKTGMEDVGRPRRVLQPITERQARLLYEALGEVLGIESASDAAANVLDEMAHELDGDRPTWDDLEEAVKRIRTRQMRDNRGVFNDG